MYFFAIGVDVIGARSTKVSTDGVRPQVWRVCTTHIIVIFVMFQWFSLCFRWSDNRTSFVIIHELFMYVQLTCIPNSPNPPLLAFPSFPSFPLLPLSFLCFLLLPFLFPPFRTLEDRAKRLFSTKGVPIESLDPSLFAKTRSTVSSELNETHKQTAFLEAQVYKYADLLAVSATIVIREHGCTFTCSTSE